MIRDITIGQYYPGKSLLHKIDPRMKLILTFAIIVVKCLFGGLGCNFANPAITARVFMLITFSAVAGGANPAGAEVVGGVVFALAIVLILPPFPSKLLKTKAASFIPI